MHGKHNAPTAFMKGWANITLFTKCLHHKAQQTALCFLCRCLCVRYIPSLSFHGLDIEVCARFNPVCEARCSAGLLSAWLPLCRSFIVSAGIKLASVVSPASCFKRSSAEISLLPSCLFLHLCVCASLSFSVTHPLIWIVYLCPFGLDSTTATPFSSRLKKINVLLWAVQ